MPTNPFTTAALKKAAPYLALAAALLSVVLAFRVMSVTDRYSRLKGEYQANVATAEANEQAAAIAIASAQHEITIRDTKIAAAESRLKTLAAAASTLTASLSVLEREYQDILAAGGDKDAQIDNLKTQIDAWRARFTLAESAGAEKDTIIFGLREQYALQVSISASWEAQFKAERQLRFDAESLMRSLEWKVRATRAKSTIVTLAATAVGGYLIYDKLTGK